MLDYGEPVAVLLFAVLHFIIDDQEAESVTQKIRDALIPGSYVAISHASAEGVPAASHEQMMRLYAKTSSPFVGRTRTQIARFFGDFELIELGVVHVPLWKPEGPNDLFLTEPERGISVGTVGRKALPPYRSTDSGSRRRNDTVMVRTSLRPAHASPRRRPRPASGTV